MSEQWSTIILYDVTSLLDGQTISPNVCKTRLLLNYRKIPFKTIWITFPEIESTCKSVGAPPTATKTDGSPLFTVPFITVTPPPGSSEPVLAISDSRNIAEYIEKTFPDPAHPLFPEGTRVYHALFMQFKMEKILSAMMPLIKHDFIDLLTTPEWYANTRESVLGCPVENIYPKDDAALIAAQEKLWKGFDALAKALDEEGEGNHQIVKGRVTYAEMDFVALLFFFKRVSQKNVWVHLKDRNERRWEKLVDAYGAWLPAHRD